MGFLLSIQFINYIILLYKDTAAAKEKPASDRKHMEIKHIKIKHIKIKQMKIRGDHVHEKEETVSSAITAGAPV